jgi:hypothetical protein
MLSVSYLHIRNDADLIFALPWLDIFTLRRKSSARLKFTVSRLKLSAVWLLISIVSSLKSIAATASRSVIAVTALKAVVSRLKAVVTRIRARRSERFVRVSSKIAWSV